MRDARTEGQPSKWTDDDEWTDEDDFHLSRRSPMKKHRLKAVVVRAKN
ncbi:MAG: hypothetical protein ABI886_13700 [Betaproteobacteria bacterium]